MKHAWKRLLSVLLVTVMAFSLATPGFAASDAGTRGAGTEAIELTPVDPASLDSLQLGAVSESADIEQETYALTDTVRVSIVLDKASTIEAGYSIDGIAANRAAKAYRDELKSEQAAMTSRIESAIGGKLDVKWNLTLAANIISANVAYGKIDSIKAVPGVADVVIENRYELDAGVTGDEPNMGTSTVQTGSTIAWAAGYTGAGSKVAIIDTGAGIDHQSFDPDALLYALEQDGIDAALMTADDIAAVSDQLNSGVGSEAYINAKIPYGYNYVDENLDVTHENDTQGSHGSHVAGIATANRYIKKDGEFVEALTEVGVQGVAPDAQLLVMKVFGAGGGAYDSDYMVAIEDAIILGCDSANLSLGSGQAGLSFSGTYENIMNKLVENGLVVTMSLGNSYSWYNTPYNPNMYGYLYTDDVNYATGGSPGSFTNSLTVASVNNSGQTGMPIEFGDLWVFYSETSGYGNEPITTIAGEHEFVYIDTPGVDDNDHVGAEGDDFLALGSEIVSGKVAMCNRGTSSFFAKANAAIAQGAIAVIICNNQDGVINMNLTGYEYSAPAVSITLEDANAIKAQSTLVEDGAVPYYTGTLNVTETLGLKLGEDTNEQTMSDFSSWGVPGTLVLKPELTAPGGSIYSVVGHNFEGGTEGGGTDTYESWSGTSMASPQVAGMAAVAGQYIRENGLEEKTGLTARQLINSLLMGTAEPLVDEYGEYWSLLKQGAGEANVGRATQAKSYILMNEDSTMFPDSAKDGKVKAELGDDPDRTGTYTFGFTINPLTDEKVEYNLSSDLFIQWIAGNAGYGMLMDEGTAALTEGEDFTASYVVDGEEFVPYYTIEADVNKDGETNEADAQAILDYLSGANDGSEYDLTVADVDGDESVTTADARAILEAAAAVTIVVENEPVNVEVTLQLTDDMKAILDYYFKKGAYIQAYTFIEGITTGEGEIVDVTQSVPMLAFYGNWTDPSMFDRTSVIDEAYGTGKLPYLNNANTNYMTIKNEKGVNQIYMGNPFVVEDEFPADRLAINGDRAIATFNYLPIRNIGTLGFAIQGEEGKVLWSAVGGSQYAPYYYVNGAVWQNTSARNYSVNKTLASLGLKAGDKATIGLWALPEYYSVQYAKANGSVATTGILDAEGFAYVLENGLAGEGAALAYNVTVDNDAPVVEGALRDLISGDITVKAKDDQYIAYVGVMNKSGSEEFIGIVPEQTEPGQAVEVPLDLEGVQLPATALLVVGDYAGNVAAFKFETGAEQEDLGGKLIGFNYNDGATWVEIDPAALYYQDANNFGGVSDFGSSPVKVTAADYVDGYVFMAGSDGYFYAASAYELEEAARVGKFSETTAAVHDMAYNSKDGKLYALGENNTIYSVDLNTGAMTEEVAIAITNPRNSDAAYLRLMGLAIDDSGNFYAMNYGAPSSTFLYTFTLDQAEEGVIADLAPINNETSGNAGLWFFGRGGALAWDHNNSILYAAGNYNYTTDTDHNLFTLDLTTGKGTKVGDSTQPNPGRFDFCMTGLFSIPGNGSGITPATEATSVEVEPTELNILRGQTAELSATVYPWTLEEKGVTWASEDETIATVTEDGAVTGTGVGTTVITVTTVAEPNLTATVDVTVEEAPVAELRGIIWNTDGKGLASVFSTDDTNNWQGEAEVGELTWGALVDDVIFGSTDDTMYAVDADTYEITTLGGIVSDWIPSDAVGLPADAVVSWGLDDTFRVGGLCNNGTYFEVLDPEAGSLNYWDLSSAYGSDPMAVVAYAGMDEDGSIYLYVITESGALWSFEINSEGSMSREAIGQTGLDLSGVADVTNQVWASMAYDAENEFLYVTEYDGSDDFAYLYAIDAADPTRVAKIGDFNESVWPVVGLYQYEPATDLVLKVAPTDVTIYERETAQLNVKVKLGDTNEYTIESADPEIATVDENGLITAVAEGETTVTITTVDANDAGETLTETVNVTVKGLMSIPGGVTIAQISDADGDHFAYLSLEDLSYTPIADAPGKVTSGAMTGDIYMAGVGTSISALSGEDLTTPADYSFDKASYASYPAQDIANYPMFINEDGELDEHKALFTTSLGWLVTPDMYGWNLSEYYPDMAGIAFVGTDEDDDGNQLFDYLMLTAGGTLHLLQVDYAAGGIYNAQALMETGIKLADQSDASLAVVTDNESYYGLLIADNGTKKLWYVDLMTDELELGLFGTLDVDNLSGLVGNFDFLDSVAGEIEPDPLDEAEVLTGFYFESDPAEEGWTFVDADADNYGWSWNKNAGSWFGGSVDLDTFAYEGTGCIMSGSYINTVGALEPDNWAISPAIDLSNLDAEAAPVLSVYAKGLDSSFAAENFALYAGTSADPESMVKISDDFTATGSWKRYTADLSSFVGESEVYVAIRHYDITDQYILLVDQVEILTDVAEGGSVEAPEVDLSDFAAPAFASSFVGDGAAKLALTEDEQIVTAELERIGSAANVSRGGLNAVNGYVTRPQNAERDLEAEDDDTTLAVKLFEDEATKNGLMTVTYDPEKVSVASVESSLAFKSYHDDAENGVITFAYASAEEIAAEEVLATVKFTYSYDEAEGFETEVTIETKERNDEFELAEEPVIVELTIYGDPEWTWTETEDGYTATAAWGEGEDAIVEDAEVTSETTDPTCEEPGVTVYTATVEFNGKAYTDTLEVEIEATGHAWGEPEWTWAEDFSTATAKFVCANDPEHVEEIEATVTEEILVAAACEKNGLKSFTATVELDGVTYEDKQGLAIEATGHAWGEPEWTWSDDMTLATATFTCASCGEVETLIAEITTETVEPACEEAGKTIYTATVELDGETCTDTKEVAIEATGHAWGEPEWTWNEDNSSATVKFVCANDETHTKEITATVTSETKGNVTTYTATVELDGETYTDTKTVEEPEEDDPYVPDDPTPSQPADEFKFVDVPDDAWYHDDVYEVYEKGFMDATGEDTFSPLLETTREEIVTILWRLAGKPAPKTSNNFTDSTGNPAIEWAFEIGLAKGRVDANGVVTFAPNANVTRQELAAFFYRYAQIHGASAPTIELTFDDTDEIGDWALESVRWCVENGIVNGTGDNKMTPNGTATRCELAAMALRMDANFNG